jgi:UDP-N-acetylmuramyl pentapeptide phosphotransferase/UDP-N-acetylglucosamine-1-phosphate transferase
MASPAVAAVGALAARAAWEALGARPPGGGARWTRTNHRGEALTLLEGPAFAVGSALAAATAPGVPARLRAAGALAAAGAGAFGVLDDLAERGRSKGLRGHLSALARGEVTTGGLKVAGIGATGLAVAALALPRRGPAVDLLVAGALVAGCANLANLLDLRPGRALKVSLLAAPAMLSATPSGALVAAACGPAAALLPEDLAERSMLGDAGANAAGAVLGAALVAGSGRRTRAAVLAAVTALTLASEKVSFTAVIERTPGLREFDSLGRRPC